MMTKHTLSKRTQLAIVLLLVIGFPMLWFISATNELLADNGPFDYQEDSMLFDEVLWKQKISTSFMDNPRHFMLDDLRENHLKIGMDTMEAKDVLGQPDIPGFGYRLGFYISPFDPSFLILEIDTQGKIEQITVKTQ